METKERTSIDSLTQYTIYIVGASRFSNQALAHVLQKELSADTVCIRLSGEISEVLKKLSVSNRLQTTLWAAKYL